MNVNPPIVFRDTAMGGWYCRVCQREVHPDLVNSHLHSLDHTGTVTAGYPVPLESNPKKEVGDTSHE